MRYRRKRHEKIGIIDYFIDEWHSNTYLGLFVKANEELGLDYQIAYGYAEVEKEGRLTTEAWCQKNNIEVCESIEELCEKSDNILILAPANPETHLKYARIALPYGKTTYIDKTFAPDLQTAKEIFAIAKKHNTKIFTSSALRFAEEIADFSDVKNAIITGGGGNLEEYIIHQIEMAVKLSGGERARQVHVFNKEKQATIVIDFESKSATLNYSRSSCGFSVDVESTRDRCDYRKIASGTEFYNLIKTILTFFEASADPFDPNETLQILAIRDAVLKAIKLGYGQHVYVENDFFEESKDRT